MAEPDLTMTEAEREEFLADVHVGILAIARKDKGPLALPIWYQYEDGAVIIGIGGNSLKAKLIRAAGRATMTVQTETPPYKYVSVEGPVELLQEQRDDFVMASRYLGPEFGRWYADTNPSTSDTVIAKLTPERWITCDYGKGMG
ncbi:MAG: putative flavin-nucleotide-binding protein [Ilumatobacteraceae bacterium]|nr:putative flavin-nucleotide-binding protein [Ilumatobacteraceae bacterium]MCU1391448.1 putative flavin-nucleotide-binding protein [Ilumatobacteraceae bacterium]